MFSHSKEYKSLTVHSKTKIKTVLESLQDSEQNYRAQFFIFVLVFFLFRFEHVRLAISEYFCVNHLKLQIKLKRKQS